MDSVHPEVHSYWGSLPAEPVYPNATCTSPPDYLQQALAVEQSLPSALHPDAIKSRDALCCLVFLLRIARVTLAKTLFKISCLFNLLFFFNTPLQMTR